MSEQTFTLCVLKNTTKMKYVILILFAGCILFSACSRNGSASIDTTLYPTPSLSSTPEESDEATGQISNDQNDDAYKSSEQAYKSKEEYMEEIFGVSPTPSTYYPTPSTNYPTPVDMGYMAPEWHNCSSCGGSGACQYCGGTGYYGYSRSGNCEVCYGTGQCVACDGAGGWYI